MRLDEILQNALMNYDASLPFEGSIGWDKSIASQTSVVLEQIRRDYKGKDRLESYEVPWRKFEGLLRLYKS